MRSRAEAKAAFAGCNLPDCNDKAPTTGCLTFGKGRFAITYLCNYGRQSSHSLSVFPAMYANNECRGHLQTTFENHALRLLIRRPHVF